VKYEPGELKVVVYDEQGKNVGQQIVKTAGKPAALKLEADRTVLCSDGEDLAYVIVSLIDKDGTEIPDAADQLTFEVKGAGSFRAACNGDATSLESFTQPSMKLFSGKVVVTVQAGQKAGKLMLTVKDKTNKRIKAKTITIDVK
jgi:beta-galactosidase